MDKLKKITALSLIITFFLGTGVGYFISIQNEPCKEEIPYICPAELTSLDALDLALSDPEVTELLQNKSVNRIGFSRVLSQQHGANMYNYTQIVFNLEDSDPDDRLMSTSIYVQINDSCMVCSAYESYPAPFPPNWTGNS